MLLIMSILDFEFLGRFYPKELSYMFFKEDKNFDRPSLNIACYSTFVYWALLLFINVILETSEKRTISSLFILLSGVTFLFISEKVAKLIRKRKVQ